MRPAAILPKFPLGTTMASGPRTHGPGGALPVVRHLRQEPSQADRVGRSQVRAGPEVGAGKRLLREALTVVERALHRDSPDVAAERRELRFLHSAHVTVGIEHHDPRPGDAVERVRHRAAGVARCGDQHGQWRLALFMEMRQQTGEHAGAHVLEREGRAMKELEDRQAIVKRDQRCREVQRLAEQSPQIARGQVVGDERLQHAGGDVGERVLRKCRPLFARQRRQARRHIEPAIGRQPCPDRLSK